MKARLEKLVGVRPEEAPALLLTFLYISTVMASFILAKSVRNGLFLSQFGAYKLVYVYVAVPLLLLVFVPLYTSMTARAGQRVVITASLAFFFLNVLGFWIQFRLRPSPVLAAVFYVWVNCYGIIAPVQVWNFANSIFDARQAKRLFGLIGSGASAGAIVGGLLARFLVGPMGGAVGLLLVFAALIALAGLFVSLTLRVIPRRLPPVAAGLRRGSGLARSLGSVARSPYLRRITMLVFLVAVVTQWTQFQFLLVAQQRHGSDANRLTALLGEFNMYFGIVAILVQVLLTGPALRRFGIAVTILLLPISLGLGSIVILALPSFGSVLLTNGFDQSLRFSIDKASFELLYLPLPPAVRAEVKAAIDMIFNRVADAAGGLLLGLATQGFSLGVLALPGAGLGLRGTAVLNLVMLVAWIGVAVTLRRGYVDAIRESIREHRLDPGRGSVPFLDRSTTGILAGRLGLDDEGEVLYALELLASQRRQATHPALRPLLGHPSATVRSRAVALLDAAGDASVLADVEVLLEDPSLDVRTEALGYLTHQAGIDPLARIRQHGDFPDYSVRAGIVCFLARPGRSQNLEAARLILEAMVDERGPAGRRARLEAARLLSNLPEAMGDLLGRLLADEDLEVARLAVRAAGRASRLELLPALIERLGDPELCEDVTTALAGMGEPGVATLRERLADPGVAPQVKREIPPVLVRIGTPSARRALLASLLQGDPLVRLRTIASLNKLRPRDSGVALDEPLIETALAAEITGHYRSHQVLAVLARDFPEDEPALESLRGSMAQEVERIFRLMGLLVPGDDLESAYRALSSPSPSARANALELLDNILKPPLRNLVVPLLDSHVRLEERAALANRIVGVSVASREQAVQVLLACDDPWLRACAARAIGALALRSLEGKLDQWLDDPDPLLRATARAAKLQLRPPGEAAAGEPEAPFPGSWDSPDRLGMG